MSPRQRRRRHRDDGHRRGVVRGTRRAACDASNARATAAKAGRTTVAARSGATGVFLRTVGCAFSGRQRGARAWRRINERDRVTDGVTHTLQRRVKRPFVAHSRCLHTEHRTAGAALSGQHSSGWLVLFSVHQSLQKSIHEEGAYMEIVMKSYLFFNFMLQVVFGGFNKRFVIPSACPLNVGWLNGAGIGTQPGRV